MRIWLQVPMKLESEFEPFFRCGFEVARPETEVTVKFLGDGITSIDDFGQEAIRFFNDRVIAKSVLSAEEQGFDAVIIGCFFDPGLSAAKQMLGIPVVGLAESSLHFSAMASRKFAVVTSDRAFVVGLEDLLRSYSMGERLISPSPVRSISPPKGGFERCLMAGDVTPIVSGFREAARACRADGAELILVGCGALACVLTGAGVHSFEGVPVVNPYLVALKTAETLVDLARTGYVVPVSRAGTYGPLPPSFHERFPCL